MGNSRILSCEKQFPSSVPFSSRIRNGCIRSAPTSSPKIKYFQKPNRMLEHYKAQELLLVESEFLFPSSKLASLYYKINREKRNLSTCIFSSKEIKLPIQNQTFCTVVLYGCFVMQQQKTLRDKKVGSPVKEKSVIQSLDTSEGQDSLTFVHLNNTFLAM